MKRTRSFVLLLFSVVMVLSLILFYSPTGGVQETMRASDETVANVNGEYISVGEIIRQQEMYSQFGASPAKTLLNGLISRRILRLEANRLGLRATDAEVAQAIRDQYKSDDGTPFDQVRYEENVAERYGSVANFEQAMRDDLSAAKVQAFITSGVTVSEQEVIDDYKRQNTKFDLTYIPISVTDLAQTIKPSDEELKNYFEQNKATYYISSPQKKIRYIFLETSKVGEKLDISDEELKAEYEKLPEDRKKAGVEGQEIVLRVPRPEEEQTQMQKANQIVTQLR
ncbi:MAG TPA: SurA N-terminal domain-containing protein, partial [Pyrinomonadaceae bacterium]|nr:SurA N-terminal domain-containing protein [Pyrinomonadaceae bacterium]